jgi:asparagine synthase (glutamine-hydrolysing)
VLGPGVLDRMTDVMVHRGPNDRGTYEAPGVALGARRLSIVDVQGGHQPVRNEDGRVWATQNGELYNHLELRRELEGSGHRLPSRCDTEILPHLYERDRDRYPERLRGKFATAVWDGRERRAVLARDRLGVKPLYWARRGDLVVFASELKSVLASGLIEPELDYDAIDAYLTFGFVPGPRTPLKEVHKLLPGHRLVIDEQGARPERYWAYPHPQVAEPRLSEHEYAERLLELLDESVRLRLMSDVPLGAMLSGGLDSSLIVALMARHMSEPVKTFSVGFREAGEGNELADARLVADHFGTDHHELELSLHDQQLDLPQLVWHLDEPLADLSALGFLHLSQLAAQHVTVALSGQGADELLGGYRKHLAASLTGRVPPALRRWVPAPLGGKSAIARAARTAFSDEPVERLLAMSGHVDGAARRALYRGPLAGVTGEPQRVVAARVDGFSGHPLDETLLIDGQLALVDDMLHYFDRASMAHSLEVRVPFLDHHLVEYCATIPHDLKVRRVDRKHLLKRVARGILPDHAIDKRKQGFFHGAIDAWFRAQSEGITHEFLGSPGAKYVELLDRDSVREMANRHASGSSNDGRLLLAILILEVWLRDFVPRARVTTPTNMVAA